MKLKTDLRGCDHFLEWTRWNNIQRVAEAWPPCQKNDVSGLSTSHPCTKMQLCHTKNRRCGNALQLSDHWLDNICECRQVCQVWAYYYRWLDWICNCQRQWLPLTTKGWENGRLEHSWCLHLAGTKRYLMCASEMVCFSELTLVPPKYGKCRKSPFSILADGLSEIKLPSGPTAGSQSWLFKVDEIMLFVIFINFFWVGHGMSVSNRRTTKRFTSNGTFCKHRRLRSYGTACCVN